MRFRCILSDPPWTFDNWSYEGTRKGAVRHYACMPAAEVLALPVAAVAAEDSALFLWATDPLLPLALEVGRAWGFEYKTVAFYWVKTTTTGLYHYGCGYWTRANPEQCLLFTRGVPERLAKGIRRLVVAPVGEHSRKPDEVRESIERLVPGPRLELFAREERPGWTSLGDGIDGRDIRAGLCSLMDQPALELVTP